MFQYDGYSVEPKTPERGFIAKVLVPNMYTAEVQKLVMFTQFEPKPT
jgi:hypothetical protein